MTDSQEYITVCQLMRAHGVKGYIKAMPLTHDLTRCKSLKDVRVKKRNGEIVELTLEDLWISKYLPMPPKIFVRIHWNTLLPN